MEERRPPSFNVPWPLILALVAAGGGVFWLRSPLISSRPAGEPQYEQMVIADQDVAARLWQDPFEALDRYKKAQEGKGATNHPLANLAVQIRRNLDANPAHKFRVLLVMVSGGPYVEDAETRLRSRHAIVSALDVAGYAAEDQEHVGYVEVSRTPAATISEAKELPPLDLQTNELTAFDIPFEWFYARKFHPPVKASASAKKILVVWLKEEAFSDLPVIRLAQLKKQIEQDLAKQLDKPADSFLPRLKFSILGPKSSTTLQRMLPDYTSGQFSSTEKKRQPEIQKRLKDVEMYSYSATAMEDLLVRDPSKATEDRSSVGNVLKQSYDLEFKKIICTDDQLAHALIEELDRRGVSITNHEHCVALLSEHDTLYGRVLPFTFAVEALHAAKPIEITNRTGLRSNIIECLRGNPSPLWPAQLWRYSYLRGIDGKLPGDASSLRGKPSQKKEEKTNDQEEWERPQGQNQLDYIPRLAMTLKAQDEEHRREGTGALKAIGILGSDVYDKLLILQALRDRFPGVIFFTTDLDARLWHPSQLKWSRNLIVASTFGLELDREIQRRIPPFRDNYQTALFYAALRALGHCEETAGAALTPRLFEIGRNGAYDLSVDPPNGPAARIHPPRQAPLEWWTGRRHWWIGRRIWMALGVISSTIVLLSWAVLLQKGTNNLDLKKIRNFALGYLGLTVVLGVAGWLLFRRFDWRQEEPLSFFEGISLWPTEMVRLLAAVLSFHFMIKNVYDVNENNEKLQIDFGLDPPDTGTQFFKKLVHWWHQPRQRAAGVWEDIKRWAKRSWVDRRQYYAQLKAEQDQTEDAQKVWADYLRAGSAWNRTWRVVAAAVIYLGFSACLIYIFPRPTVPFRGHASYWADVVVRYVSMIMLMGLMFFAADATRLCISFIKRLVEKRTTWPGLDTLAIQRGLKPADLEGWREIEIIAQRSEVVGRLILYPFLVLALMILARAPYFDNWNWPLSVILIFALNSLYAIVLALALRRAAEKARRKVLRYLNDSLLEQLGQPRTDARLAVGDRAEQLRALIREIESIRQGGFAPLSQHPLIAAVLMPFGGAGALALLEQLAYNH